MYIMYKCVVSSRCQICYSVHLDFLFMVESDRTFRLTQDNPYLALAGELWGVYCEDLEEKLPRYNGTAL